MPSRSARWRSAACSSSVNRSVIAITRWYHFDTAGDAGRSTASYDMAAEVLENNTSDAFGDPERASGQNGRVDDFGAGEAGDQRFTLINGYRVLKQAARDWERFTSATPFRVPIPEESSVRPVRQYPIETDPPDHGTYRRIIADRFNRAAADRHRPHLAEMVDDLLDQALSTGELHVVESFALPIVARGIALTMGRADDTDRFVSWGLHVFVDPATGERGRDADLDAYLAERVDSARIDPADDIFSDRAQPPCRLRPWPPHLHRCAAGSHGTGRGSGSLRRQDQRMRTGRRNRAAVTHSVHRNRLHRPTR